ncbi:MAG: hypothetical protein DHS20C02_06900 [Micavibrio sp.]|nr:MAG: hypothetical protein DHS20C02_06900 [Micavibrio sp.]
MAHEALTNHPDLWQERLPRKTVDGHKYDYGHAVIYGAPVLTGATRLAAESCARMGAGLVTVLANEETANIYRETLKPHILVRDDLTWDDERVTARLYGSGGLSVEPEYKSKRPTVLDADALQNLPKRLEENYILTPHEGEFTHAFPDIKGSKLMRAQQAAQEINAIIVLKGHDTIIAHPEGRVVINDNAPETLATAGTGDVFAGMITGLVAGGIEPFWASCAAAWIHGEAARRFGVGLVASDLPDIIPDVLRDLS